MQFIPHSEKQERAIFSEKPIVLCGTGIQWGKTEIGSIKTKKSMCTFTSKDDNFLVLAPTYKIMQQSTLPAFLRIMDGLGNYNKVESVFKMYTGGTCYMRTGTDPDSIVGVRNVRHIWGDEAGKYSLYFWENIQARSDFCRAPICLTTSPYALNWIYKEFIRPMTKDPECRPDVELIRARSDENPYFPKDRIEQRRKTMDARRFNALYGGEWTKMEGLVYDCFDEDLNTCEPFSLPPGSKIYAGVDWGYTAPAVITVRAVTPDGFHYQIDEVYERAKTRHDLVAIAQRRKQILGIELFICDPEDPAAIEEFNRAGLPAIAANNDIRAGIDAHYELIKSRRYKIFRGTSPHTLDEMETYHYPEPGDLDQDKAEKEQKPVAQQNHASDSNRYISLHTFRPRNLTPVIVQSSIDKKYDKGEDVIKRVHTPSTTVLTERWD